MATTHEDRSPTPQNGKSAKDIDAQRAGEAAQRVGADPYMEAPPEVAGHTVRPEATVGGGSAEFEDERRGQADDGRRSAPFEERAPVSDGRGRPAASLVRELVGESSALVRAEIALAKTELQENITEAKRGAAAMGSGAAVLHTGLLALVATLILALSLVWPAWLAALVVGAVITVIGVAMVAVGRRKASVSGIKPDRTLRAFEHNRQFARDEKNRAMERWR
jgi:uncharacterized membrane protein YqjE